MDVLPTPKTCTFDCIYCQLGKTFRKISKPEDLNSSSYPGINTILKDLERMLKKLRLEEIDYITFSGSGEPTLNLRLGKIIKQVKRVVGNLPVAVLTNSSLVNRKDVRENLGEADFVIAKLDASSQKVFEAINRPADNFLLEEIVDGLKILKHSFSCRLALQIMFVRFAKNKLNTSLKEVKGLVRLAEIINPDEIQLNIPTRPASEKYVKPPGREEMRKITKIFMEKLGKPRILSRVEYTFKSKTLSLEAKKTEILKILKRIPCRLQDLVGMFKVGERDLKLLLNQLIRQGKIVEEVFLGEKYYKSFN